MSIWIKSYFQLLFIFFSLFFSSASSHTDRQKGLCSKHDQRNTTENVGLDLSKLSFFVAEFRVRARLTTNLSTGFGICDLTGINFSSLLNGDDWFQGPAANLSKL